MEPAVERVVTVMRNRYQERLYVPELAADEYFSPFHFTRIFRRETGVAPSQYLTAVRLFEAKQMLLSTSLSVADIACRVGYPGIGTFTTRFTRLVGIPPRQYRRLPPDRMLCITDDVRRLPYPDLPPAWAGPSRLDGHGGTVLASVRFATPPRAGRVLVGIFDDPVPQGPPVAWRLAGHDSAEPWRFDGVPDGRWVVIAVGEGHSTILFGAGTPVEVRAGRTVRVEVETRRPRRTDPPIMVPLGNQAPGSQRQLAA